MSEQNKKQFNIRLNKVAEQQLEELSEHYNLPKAAIIKMAVSHLYKRYFPESEDDGDDPFEPAPEEK